MTPTANSSSRASTFHVICERDVGLFSLIQQVIANIPWALKLGRIPVVYFQERTCYWTPNGYHDRDNVWEYYFEPVVSSYPASCISQNLRAAISHRPPTAFEAGYEVDGTHFVTAHFGDHADLEGLALSIPYLFQDPGDNIRRRAAAIIRDFIRPREYIRAKVTRFLEDHLKGQYVIGVHIRGTDAVSRQEIRPYRKGSLHLPRYVEEIERLLQYHSDAAIFVASDDQSSVDFVKNRFGSRVIAYDSLRHQGGETAGSGPTGWIMPAYIAGDRDRAARNGEEAVIEYLLLAHCDYLIHNGSSLARTVLLKSHEMAHINTHAGVQSPGQPVHTPQVRPEAGFRPGGGNQAGAADSQLIDQVKRAKARRQSSMFKYSDRSRIAFIVHSFNRATNIDQIISGLRLVDDHELIVCDDGSLDDSRRKWAAELTRPNDFLIYSNDLHEIRILDRAIRFAASDIVCLVQDDDTIPGENTWVDHALDQFKKHADLAILGGFMGFHGFNPDPGRVKCVWGDQQFQFVEHVNIGPYFIRKLHYIALGGWDFSFSRVGEPGICFDNELCLRAWTNGYKVGYRFVPFKGKPYQYSLDGGTMLFSREVRMRNQWKNHRRISVMYGSQADQIAESVGAANRQLGISAHGLCGAAGPPSGSRA
jgi:hypothetical protein